MDIATAKDITPCMHEVAWHFFDGWNCMATLTRWALNARSTANMEIKEGFRKGSNHQPQCMLKSGKVTVFRTGQVVTHSTLMAHHRVMHRPTHRAQPLLRKAKACAVNAEMAERAATKRRKM
eukprot:jgi/Tetstr1/435492/TSEL_024397.t1